MPTTTKKRTFSLPQQQAAYIDQLVRSGTYASASEVVRAGLRSLQERDAAVEQWLRTEVAETYDAWKSGKTALTDAKTVFDIVRAHHRSRTKKTA